MKRVAVDAIPGDEPVALTAERSHHLLRVCRLVEGDAIEVFDGSGRVRAAEITAVSQGIATIRGVGEVREARPSVEVHLVLGLPKGPATDDAIRMATEAGATAIHPVWADRTQGRPDRTDRWRRIAESAAAQCGRADVPEVSEPRRLEAVLSDLDACDLFLAHPGGDRPAPTGSAPRGVLIGPEGGWSAREVELALGAGATPIGLGEWILRSPTAAAIAIARVATELL